MNLIQFAMGTIVFCVVTVSSAAAQQSFVTNATPLEKPQTHGGFPAFAISPDGETAAGGTGAIKMSADGRSSVGGGEVVLWNTGSGQMLKSLGEHGATVRNLEFSEDGKTLVSASRENGVIKVWDMPSGKLRHTLNFEPEEKTSHLRWPLLSICADGSTLVTVNSRSIPIDEDSRLTTGGELVVWDLNSGKQRWSKSESDVVAAVLTPDGRGMVSVNQSFSDPKKDDKGRTRFRTTSTLQSWHAGAGKVLTTAELKQVGSVDLVALVDKDTVMLLKSRGLSRHDRRSGEVIESFEWNKDRRAGAATLSANGKLIGRSWPGWLEVVDATAGETVGVTTTEFPNHYWNVSFSPDMKLAIGQRTGGQDSGPVLLQLATQ